jgi:cytochrome P450
MHFGKEGGTKDRSCLSSLCEVDLAQEQLFRPPAPMPQAGPLRPLAFLRTLWNNPIEAWTAGYFERAIVTTRLPFGEVAVINDPVAIRRVLADNRDNYPKDGFQKRMLAVLSNGLLTAEDGQWRMQRRALAPALALRNVRRFAPVMRRAVGDLVERWRSRDGEVIDVADEVTELALAVLERTIFSDGIAGNGCELRSAMRIYFDSLGRIDPFDLLNLPDFVPRIGRLRARAAVRVFHHAVDGMIAKRGRLDARAMGSQRDLLTLMLNAYDPETGRRLSSAEIRANVITFMSAGHESTANAVAWALFLLSQSSAWRERIAAEAARELDGPAETLPDRLVETRAVVEEALRLYPPLAAISRVALGPDELAGTPIRRGAMIVISPYVLHRHRLWWKQPEFFNPARFLPPTRAGIDRYVYMPFGAGPRGCIGSVFALQEALVAVAAIVREFELDVAPGHAVWPLHRITLRPRRGLPMTVRRRVERVKQCLASS